MKILENNRGKILVGIAILCFVVLSVAEYRGFFGGHAGVWSVSFVHPMSEDLTFEVSNKSPNREFEYRIFEEKKPIGEGTLMVDADSSRQLDASGVMSPDALPLEGKIRIRVKNGAGEEREIFKIVESF